MYRVVDHRLHGPDVSYVPTDHHDADIAPRFLVFHYTVLGFDDTVHVFRRGTPGARVSAHLVVARDGRVVQMVDFDRRAWHAGTSAWAGLTDLNSHSIGIECENAGWLRRSADGFVNDNGRPIPADEVIARRHRNPLWASTHWQSYSPAQVDACSAIAEALAEAYAIEDVVGHDDIAPTRKQDPGPAFPLEAIRTAALARSPVEPSPPRYRVAVAMLNIRNGPAAAFSLAAPALAHGTMLEAIGPSRNGWLHVRILARGDATGWVSGVHVVPYT